MGMLLYFLLVYVGAAPSPRPRLDSVKYQFYANSNVHWDQAQWDAEFAAMAAVRIERVTVRNPLDSFYPGYSVSAPEQHHSTNCSKTYTAFFDVISGGTLQNDSCVVQWQPTRTTSEDSPRAMPLDLLVKAAQRHNVSVIVGLAWSGSAPADIASLRVLASLQQRVADRIYSLYGTLLSGVYTEVEMNNCHTAAYNAAYVTEYLAPVSAHVAALAKATGTSIPPFIYADPYFVPLAVAAAQTTHDDSTRIPTRNCLGPSEFAAFWRGALDAAPAFSLIAPQDGVGAHNLSHSTVGSFLDALRTGLSLAVLAYLYLSVCVSCESM